MSSPLYSSEFFSFLAGCQKLATDNLNAFENLAKLQRVEIVVQPGKRYVKLVRHDIEISTGNKISGSVHCFVDLRTGDVLKAAGFNSPAKGTRGNIFDESNGLARMGCYGPAYNR